MINTKSIEKLSFGELITRNVELSSEIQNIEDWNNAKENWYYNKLVEEREKVNEELGKYSKN